MSTPRIHSLLRRLAVVVLMLCAGHVAGHGVVVESTPTDAAVLAVSPPVVRLRFNASLEPAMTRVTLVDVTGRETSLEVEPPAAAGEVAVRLPPLAPGVYRVRYRVLARDGHVTEGAIRFTVQRP